MAEVMDEFQQSGSVEQMVKTYAAMWDKHGIPGRVASNPVNRDKWKKSRKGQSGAKVQAETHRRRQQY